MILNRHDRVKIIHAKRYLAKHKNDIIAGFIIGLILGIIGIAGKSQYYFIK